MAVTCRIPYILLLEQLLSVAPLSVMCPAGTPPPRSAPFLTRFASLLCHLALKHVLTGLSCPQDLEPLKSRYAVHYFGLPKGLETMPGTP